MGYNRIEKPVYSYRVYSTPYFTFLFPAIAKIEPQRHDSLPGHWFDITYPKYKAVVHCTYLTVQKDSIRNFFEDSHRLAYSHTMRAEDINVSLFSNPDHEVMGAIYDIGGDVATPIQFCATDSLSHFLRGSLYYQEKVNPDSIEPITRYIRDDIVQIIESIKWK
ncbi:MULTISPECIES: hypothetical protein [unclassified Dysgonomonas]|uniref:gliding motility lipoprotein GldD n=1 Tax=unclassified Dysgonomonas TaxID=2630389 RepID=UPI0024767F71|nr:MULTISPECIES: hypothetical protein [unclassified Dysgonomonas]